ncbi:DUF7426 family protein [Actinomadura miaoliensis]|uniref:DUF7426 domain-containing protein n=1 Tax=Actinomadura miaoliensis TaxID=430685 RepID=A0ABP7V5X6_9ACTN
MAFKDLREFVERPRLELPIDGKTYVVYDVDAATGVWAQELAGLALAVEAEQDITSDDVEFLNDDDERDMIKRFLGDTYEEMRADGVGWSDIKHAAMTVWVWVLQDEAAAEAYWSGASASGEGSARPGNRASRRASQAMARKTPRPGSTSTTRAQPPRQGARRRSRGTGSSATEHGRS